jgi:predicted AlkP superfamily phosphohydrolase/phosphomutase
VARVALPDTHLILRQGEWSNWVRVEFPLLGSVASATGMLRIYAKQIQPGLELYVSPINVDPRAPALPISHPSGYSREIAEHTGPFYTQGIAQDTSALRQRVLTMWEYLQQSELVLGDELQLLRFSLREFREGLLFFYISAIDQNSHMLWGKFDDRLLETYRRIDSAVGEVRAAAPGADLIVMSDHGFTDFARSVNLNTWLWKNGLMKLRGDPVATEQPFANVDWEATQAYGIGLNALYLNRSGREKQGIVPDGAPARQLLERIRAALLAFEDPATGRRIVQAVEIPNRGDRIFPDLIVGYSPGYRASWQTALGVISANVVEDNADAWIGDHCIDAAAVPGVLISNRKSAIADPELKDVTVSILKLFGVQPELNMTGRALF